MNIKNLISGTVAAALLVSAVSAASFAAAESAARQNKEVVIYDGEYEISGTVGFNGKQPKPIKATIQDKTGDPVALKDCECFRIEYAADQELVSKLGVAVLAGNKDKNTDNGWAN
ncbi:MAG: hypothetical protein K2N36_05780, partial [Ruminiclostridium sp.]|nr:hypothetical protein [Ruminiclostridium sp.]